MKTLILGAAAMLVAGCAMEGEEEVDSQSAEILNGYTLNPENSGHVKLNLHTPDDPDSEAGCSGTLLANRWVVSNRHCFEDVTAAGSTAVMGTQSSNISAFYVHSGYDVALVRLSTPFIMNGHNYGYRRPLYRGSTNGLQGMQVYCRGYGLNTATSGWGTLRGGVMKVEGHGPTIHLEKADGYNQHGMDGDSGGGCFSSDPTGGSGTLVAIHYAQVIDTVWGWQYDLAVEVNMVADWLLTRMMEHDVAGLPKYRLESVYSPGWCLRAQQPPYFAVMNPCAQVDEQTFTVLYDPSVGVYQLVEHDRYRCIAISLSTSYLYASACDGNSLQAWQEIYRGSSQWTFQSDHNGNCLQGSSSLTPNDVTCTTSSAQRWRLVSVP